MFSSEPQISPLRARAWGLALGTIVMVGVPIMVISAKTVQATLPLLFAAALAGAVVRRRYASLKPQPDAASLALFAFLVYAGLSGLWAREPQASVLIVLMAAGIAAGSLMLAQLLRTEPRETALHIGEGLWIGLLVGLLYTIAEIGSGQAIKMWVYNTLQLGPEALEPSRYFKWADGRLISIHRDDLSRNVVPIPLLIWPALMGAVALPRGRLRIGVCATLALLGVASIFIGHNATATAALVVGILAFAIAWYSTRLARFTLSLAWIACCLGVIPAVLLARALDAQNWGWLKLSGRLRITIWTEIAQLVADAPVFGVGADMTYAIAPRMQEAPLGESEMIGFTITHPHNVYLQIWYELGFVGAALFLAFGLLALRQIPRLGRVQRPFAFALFATAAVQIGASYNMWQIWFMCLFGFALAMFAVGKNVIENQQVGPN